MAQSQFRHTVRHRYNMILKPFWITVMKESVICIPPVQLQRSWISADQQSINLVTSDAKTLVCGKAPEAPHAERAFKVEAGGG